jgi:3D (Asp-Asp-Asp) domain-containing protein
MIQSIKQNEFGKSKYEVLLAVMVVAAIFALGIMASFFPGIPGTSSNPLQFSSNQITGAVTGVPSGNPDTRFITTAYYIADVTEFSDWCKPDTCRPNLGSTEACNVKNKGAYEAGMCNGQLSINGKFYSAAYPKNLKITEADTIATGGNLPKTASGKIPTPHRTIAVNSKQGTACYIPRGYFVYIKLPDVDGKANPWTGWYVAEDTGSAFEGKCKIDIFVGAGKDNLNAALKYISRKNPEVWVCGQDGSDCAAQTEQIQQELGTYSISPDFRTQYPYTIDVYGSIKEFADMIIERCKDYPMWCTNKATEDYNRQNQLTKNKMQIYTGDNFEKYCAKDDYPSFQNYAEQVVDCMNNEQQDCLCDVKIEDKYDDGTFTYSFSNSDTASLLTLYNSSLDLSKIQLKTMNLNGKFVGYRMDSNNFALASWTGSPSLEYNTQMSKADPKYFRGSIHLHGIDDNDLQAIKAQYSKISSDFTVLENSKIDTLRFYKENLNDLSLTNPQYAGKQMCKPVKHNFRFCTVPEQTLPVLKKSNLGSPVDVVERQVPIMFDLSFPDPAPLPVTDLEASFDMISGNIKLSWHVPKFYENLEPIMDVDHYELYCSNAEFNAENRPAIPENVSQDPNALTMPFFMETSISHCTIDGNYQDLSLVGALNQANPSSPAMQYYVMAVPVDAAGNVDYAKNGVIQAQSSLI